MTDREERQHVIEVLKQMRLDYEDFWEENDTEEIKAFNYAIASIETDLKYDLLYEETSGQADNNDLGVTSGLEKNSKKLDCISRADAIKAIQDKAKKLTNEDTINGLCGAVAILFDLPSVTPQEPRKGHWIEHPRTKELRFHHIYECSACKTQIIGNRYNVGNYKYCPHCGIEFEVEG